MEIICTRPGCPHPQNYFDDLDNPTNLKTAQQKYCISCGMPLILAGRYLPSRLLGKGGFGAAFLASDRYTPTMRKCVVKQFQPSGNLTAKQLEIAEGLFEREAVVLERLGNKHPQIPDLFAFFPLIVPGRAGGEEQYFYLVQEFIDGNDLETELAQRGAFSEGEALEVLREILKVLQFVHDNESIHRDIKPSNIMRDRHGILYLLDFGAVKQVTAGAGNPSGRSTGIYSMGFAPPEQMSGAQVYPSTDLYALAATCLILLSNKSSDELYDSYENCWNWRPHVPHISNGLANILDRMLLSTPKDRFQSARDVLGALEMVFSSSTPSPISSPPTYPQVQTQSQPITQPPIAIHSPPTQPPQASGTNPIPSSPPPVTVSRKPTFNLMEVLGSAAFTGFEGALLFVGFQSVIPGLGLAALIWGMILGGLVFIQYRRLIEGKDLPILAVVTGLIVMLFLRGGMSVPVLLGISLLASAAAIAITALFRLIYLLLAKFL
jgi:serine/threonine protein kinase